MVQMTQIKFYNSKADKINNDIWLQYYMKTYSIILLYSNKVEFVIADAKLYYLVLNNTILKSS